MYPVCLYSLSCRFPCCTHSTTHIVSTPLSKFLSSQIFSRHYSTSGLSQSPPSYMSHRPLHDSLRKRTSLSLLDKASIEQQDTTAERQRRRARPFVPTLDDLPLKTSRRPLISYNCRTSFRRQLYFRELQMSANSGLSEAPPTRKPSMSAWPAGKECKGTSSV